MGEIKMPEAPYKSWRPILPNKKRCKIGPEKPQGEGPITITLTLTSHFGQNVGLGEG